MVGVWLFNEPKTVLQRKSPTVYEVDPTGRLRFHISGQGYAAAFDGNDHPLSGDPTARTVALKRIDSRTFQETLKDASGKEVQVRRVAVSEDGNELKLTNTGVFMGGRGHRALIFRRKN
jgi:hypothetical protein